MGFRSCLWVKHQDISKMVKTGQPYRVTKLAGNQVYLILQILDIRQNPKLKMKTSLVVLNIICSAQEPTSIRYCQHHNIIHSYNNVLQD